MTGPGPTPTQLEALGLVGQAAAAEGAAGASAGGGAPPAAADALVAAIQQQAAALSYAAPDPVQLERERALASAVAHAKALQENGAAADRAKAK